MKITESQLRQVISSILQENRHKTLSPEFKRWFGRSMLMDPAGNPIKLYHGTPKDMTPFKAMLRAQQQEPEHENY